MIRLHNPRRAERLMRSAIRDLQLELDGISVLTEAASGPFAVTSLLAALAGASRVFAVTRDSAYGSAVEVLRYVREWAEALGVASRIELSAAPASRFAPEASLVTNLGFVRPLDAGLIARLPPDAAIALMMEPWECRAADVDLEACRIHDVPALGPRESHPRLQIFRYVGFAVLRLLFDAEIEAYRARILIVGSAPFGEETRTVLEAAGATTLLLDPTRDGWNDPALRRQAPEWDAVALVEYRSAGALIGGATGLPAAWLADAGIPVIHLAGVVDEPAAGVRLIPPGPLPPHTMKVTTAYAGPRPVIDLHAAGLKVGELLVRGRRATGSGAAAIQRALEHPLVADPNPAVPCG